MDKTTQYRAVVGEAGNEQGHPGNAHATIEAAKRELSRELRKYGGDGWGHIQEQCADGTWAKLRDRNPRGSCPRGA
jgi:hypothetical protein